MAEFFARRLSNVYFQFFARSSWQACGALQLAGASMNSGEERRAMAVKDV